MWSDLWSICSISSEGAFAFLTPAVSRNSKCTVRPTSIARWQLRYHANIISLSGWGFNFSWPLSVDRREIAFLRLFPCNENAERENVTLDVTFGRLANVNIRFGGVLHQRQLGYVLLSWLCVFYGSVFHTGKDAQFLNCNYSRKSSIIFVSARWTRIFLFIFQTLIQVTRLRLIRRQTNCTWSFGRRPSRLHKLGARDTFFVRINVYKGM